jgi:hypothetical protein
VGGASGISPTAPYNPSREVTGPQQFNFNHEVIHGEETGKESRQEAKEEVTGFYGHLNCKFQAACSAGCLFYRPLLGGKARQDPAANIG